MTEEQIKIISKWMVDNANRPLTTAEKELLKEAIDKAKTIEEIVLVFVLMGCK